MGIYNTFMDDDIAVQIKYRVDDGIMRTYEVGNEIDMENCILIGYEGAVVIKDGIVVMVTENVINKWGGLLNCTAIIARDNPIAKEMQLVHKELRGATEEYLKEKEK